MRLPTVRRRRGTSSVTARHGTRSTRVVAAAVGLSLVGVELVLVRDRTFVEVVDDVDFVIAAEEAFVGAEGGGVVAEPLPDSLTESYGLLDPFVSDQVDEHLTCLLADAVDTARALDDANDGPRQIVVDYDM